MELSSDQNMMINKIILIPVNLANVATVVRNASSMEMDGVELELMYQVTEAWDLMILMVILKNIKIIWLTLMVIGNY